MEKNINKWLIGLLLGTTLLSIDARSQTPKGKRFFNKVKKFFQLGLQELKKHRENKKH